MADSALVTLTISELASKIKAKAISPVELTEAALAQADRLQPTLNTFINGTRISPLASIPWAIAKPGSSKTEIEMRSRTLNL